MSLRREGPLYSWGLFSTFCGPGGSGLPKSIIDLICKEHDDNYGKIIEKHGKYAPYISFNWADQRMMDQIEKYQHQLNLPDTLVAHSAKLLWQLKKKYRSNNPSLLNSPDNQHMVKGKAIEPVSPDRKRIKTSDTRVIMPRRNTDEDAEGDTYMGDDSKAVVVHGSTTSNAVATQSSKAVALGSNGRASGHESRVIPQQPHYGLPDVVTVRIPYSTYFSVITNGYIQGTAQDLYFRTTSLYDIFINTLNTPGNGATYAPGFYNKQVAVGTASAWPATASQLQFPVVPVAGSATERGQWQEWFRKMYRRYHVGKCHWELTMHNPYASSQADVVVAYTEEAYTSTNTDNVAPGGSYQQLVENWPGFKWALVRSTTIDGLQDNFTTIKGTYYPGQANSLVTNDDEVKTWTPVGTPPTLTEQIHVKFWKSAFNTFQTSAADNYQPLNCRLTMTMEVQFRDLIQALKYPTGGGITLDAADIVAIN